MFERLQRQGGRVSTEDRTLGPSERQDVGKVVFESSLFQLGRMLFGGVLAFMALDNLRNLEERIGYAESKDAPAPERIVPGISYALLLGSLGVALWRLPRASAAAVAGFFVGVTPMMHDFWNLEDPEQKQQQMVHFLKNTALLGAALVFLQLGRRQRRRD